MGWVAAAVAVTSFVVGENAREDAKNKQEAAVREQKKARAEEEARNKAQEAAERRRQVREERLRRARVLQTSEATGVAGSSGETGAIGSMSTQLSTNVGANAAAVGRAGRISIFQQNAADLDLAARNTMAQAEGLQQLLGVGASFAMAYQPKPAQVATKAPVEDRIVPRFD